MRDLTSRMRRDECGAALITALLATVVMLALGLALLSIVDTQAGVSASERTRDRGFNLAESVLNSEAFALGRNWPATAPAGDPTCSLAGAGFGDTLWSTAATTAAAARLRTNLNSSYTDTVYTGATWQVNLCDDSAGSAVWSTGVLSNKAWDQNNNKKIWVRAQSIVDGETRVLVGLVSVRETPVLASKYGLVSGGLTDDLGATINTITSNALGGVLGGLLGIAPTVAPDPAIAAASPPTSGVTGLRCGLTDIQLIPASTCVAGTIGALGALPVVSTLLTGGTLDQFPTTTAATASNIAQLRAQAVASGTYTAQSLGGATAATTQACQLTGTPSANTIVFIEAVGASGDQYCVLSVGAAVQYKALIIGSGRVVIRGNGSTTNLTTAPNVNVFKGVVYALNLQRLAVADGGRGLGDAATPGREVVRIENGAHVKGAVNADGKSAKVSIIPPAPPALNMAQLRTAVCTPLPLVQELLCFTLGTVGDLLSSLGLGILTNLVNGILAQVSPTRANYGSAIVSDVAAINALTAYGASGVTPGTFKDLQPR